MTVVHQRLGAGLLLLALVGALWAFVGWRRGGPHSGLRLYARLVLLALLVQAGIGSGLAIRGERPAEDIHLFYGPAVLVAMLAGIGLGFGEEPRREAAVLIVAFLAVFLLGIRAVGTGGG